MHTPRTNNDNTPKSIKSKEVQNEYFDKGNRKNQKLIGFYPSRDKKQNNSISSIISQNVENSKVPVNNLLLKKQNEINHDESKQIKSNQDTTVFPNIKKKSEYKEVERTFSKENISHERDIKRPHESALISAEDNLVEENTEDVSAQRRAQKLDVEAKKKKKLKELKRLQLFSPYFANLFKSDRKIASVLKNFESADKKGSNQKIFKVYGIHKLVPRYKKKIENDES